MTDFTPELIAKAKAAKSAEELWELAKENGIELTEEEAKTCFEQLHTNGAVSDDELDAVAGGSFCGAFEIFFRLIKRSIESDGPYCVDKSNNLDKPSKLDKPDKSVFDSRVTTLPYDLNNKNKIEYL